MRSQRNSNSIASALLSIALAACAPQIATAGDVHEIDQIMDMSALTPEDFYRFVPNYLWIEPGDSVRFVNTTGNHTVKSVEGIWPDGVEGVDISNQASLDVELTSPGIYGFRCKVHARHGMFALVVVGSPEPNLEQIDLSRLNDRGERVFGELLETLKTEMKMREK